MVQVGYTTRCQSLQDKHHLGPVALGCVYPVETSTSLYTIHTGHVREANTLRMRIPSSFTTSVHGMNESKMFQGWCC